LHGWLGLLFPRFFGQGKASSSKKALIQCHEPIPHTVLNFASKRQIYCSPADVLSSTLPRNCSFRKLPFSRGAESTRPQRIPINNNHPQERTTKNQERTTKNKQPRTKNQQQTRLLSEHPSLPSGCAPAFPLFSIELFLFEGLPNRLVEGFVVLRLGECRALELCGLVLAALPVQVSDLGLGGLGPRLSHRRGGLP
jgi:hypothetical protein